MSTCPLDIDFYKSGHPKVDKSSKNPHSFKQINGNCFFI